MAPEVSALRALALDPPRALGGSVVTGTLRAEPEDFIVEERLGFSADGGEAHLLLSVEKRNANTLWVAREIARQAGVRAHDVGFAGLKDRRAVARQWFSVPRPRSGPPPAEWQGEGWRVLEALAHSRKLRRGALRGNHFCLRIRDLQGDVSALAPRLEAISRLGTPNYFGPQRFGYEGANIERASQWVQGGETPYRREERAFLFSAARSLLFNAVLASRVQAANWDQLLPGELANLDGTGSFFAVESLDETLLGRCASGDIHPTGPLPGGRGAQPLAQAAELESAALLPFADWVQALDAAGLQGERRALRVLPRDLQWSVEGDVLELSLGLVRGAYATAVLREIIEVSIPEGDAD